MANEVKYLDYQGLTLYDEKVKQWGTTKNEEIKIKQTNGKSDLGTILVTPGSTTPATYYTAAEAAEYDTEHGLVEGDPGYKVEGDLKTAAITTNTNIDVNIDGSTIVQDNVTKQLKVASEALTQYVGDINGENKYAIAVSATDANNNKIISLDINSESNAIEKTTGGVKVKLGINKFTNPSVFGDNVREAYALSANDVLITGSKNEQVIKIYKDSALLDIKLLHAIPATYYTAEEATEYNTEHGLSPGDPDYKSEGDLKTSAVKPVYTKLNGWIDIEASLRTEENLALCFAYVNVNGEIVVEAIQVGSFLRETEFKEGLQVINGEVSVKLSSEKVRIAATPEGVTPGSEQDTGLIEVATLNLSNGIQINHIQDAINYAISEIKQDIEDYELVTSAALNDLNSNKQNKLVSGTNIKTINNQSLLGEGNITIGTSISDLDDVDISNPQDGQLLQYNGTTSKWEVTDSKMEIVAPSGTIATLSCDAEKYYRIDTAVDTLAVTLPAITDSTKVNTVVLFLTAGTTPNITFAATASGGSTPSVYYQADFDIGALKTYEVNCLWNGAVWVVAAVEIILGGN